MQNMHESKYRESNSKNNEQQHMQDPQSSLNVEIEPYKNLQIDNVNPTFISGSKNLSVSKSA